MNNNDRENEILAAIKEYGYMTVKALAKHLSISESSIRRGLSKLQSTGLILRKHGGAEAIDSVSRNIPYSHRYELGKYEKKKIAQIASQLVNEGDVVFLDASSTTIYLALEIAKIKGITVITNGTEIARELSNYPIRVLLTGGLIYSEDKVMLVGSMAIDTVRSIHADIAFISSQAINLNGVITCVYQDANDVRRAMVENADKSVFLCPAWKIGKTAPFRIVTLDRIDYMVCETEIPAELTEKFPNVKFMYPKNPEYNL